MFTYFNFWLLALIVWTGFWMWVCYRAGERNERQKHNQG